MEWKGYINNVLKGVLSAVAVTVIFVAIFSLVMTFVQIKPSVFSGIYVGITSIGLIAGSIFAAKLHGQKGWLVGLAVGILFYIALYGIGLVFGADGKLNVLDYIKFSLSIFVGILSGMLGINLGKE